MGVLSGITLAVLFLLFMTAGITPETFADPAQALTRMTQDSGRFRAISILALLTTGLATIFIVGFAAKLRDKAPTRATAVLYFGILGLVGHGLGAMMFWTGVPLLVARAAADQTSAAHAWVALNAVSATVDGFGNFFVGLSILMAGWAITATGQMSSALGWFGVVAGVITALATCLPGVEMLMLGAFVFPIVWLLWAGNTLRTAA
jgi:hypothetical protein